MQIKAGLNARLFFCGICIAGEPLRLSLQVSNTWIRLGRYIREGSSFAIEDEGVGDVDLSTAVWCRKNYVPDYAVYTLLDIRIFHGGKFNYTGSYAACGTDDKTHRNLAV